jgi:hypothetical protein
VSRENLRCIQIDAMAIAPHADVSRPGGCAPFNGRRSGSPFLPGDI